MSPLHWLRGVCRLQGCIPNESSSQRFHRPQAEATWFGGRLSLEHVAIYKATPTHAVLSLLGSEPGLELVCFAMLCWEHLAVHKHTPLLSRWSLKAQPAQEAPLSPLKQELHNQCRANSPCQ